MRPRSDELKRRAEATEAGAGAGRSLRPSRGRPMPVARRHPRFRGRPLPLSLPLFWLRTSSCCTRGRHAEAAELKRFQRHEENCHELKLPERFQRHEENCHAEAAELKRFQRPEENCHERPELKQEGLVERPEEHCHQRPEENCHDLRDRDPAEAELKNERPEENCHERPEENCHDLRDRDRELKRFQHHERQLMPVAAEAKENGQERYEPSRVVTGCWLSYSPGSIRFSQNGYSKDPWIMTGTQHHDDH